ncbi:MAG: hypothetical protein GY850_31125 [bacterium]|nr:hypothetical protein [bacterium]
MNLPKMIRINNTMQLAQVDVSTAYQDKLAYRNDLEIIMEEQMIEFNQEDNLKPLLKKALGG